MTARALVKSLFEAVSLKPGHHDLTGGGSVVIKPHWREKARMQINIFPESMSAETPPDEMETARILKAASQKLHLTLSWKGDWVKTKYAGYMREAEAAEKIVRGRSRVVGKWLDTEILHEIDRVYHHYEKGASYLKEPSLSVTSIVDLLGHGPDEWNAMDRKEKTSRVQAALKRLKKAGKLNTSTGAGAHGVEARLYEPMWFAKKHGNA